jgi:hypothetical protein
VNEIVGIPLNLGALPLLFQMPAEPGLKRRKEDRVSFTRRRFLVSTAKAGGLAAALARQASTSESIRFRAVPIAERAEERTFHRGRQEPPRDHPQPA